MLPFWIEKAELGVIVLLHRMRNDLKPGVLLDPK